jgi:hypothetical protein
VCVVVGLGQIMPFYSLQFVLGVDGRVLPMYSSVFLCFLQLRFINICAQLPMCMVCTYLANLRHSHKVSGSMGSRYGVVVRGTLIARDFYTSGRK